MITQARSGFYKLAETKHHTKILYLDNDIFAWLEPRYIGDMLVRSHKLHKTDCLLNLGHYHVYEVQDEPHLSDQLHLELEVGDGHWQGYLLLTGLPDSHHSRGRIIPTMEVITGNPKFKSRQGLYKNLAAVG